MFNLFTPGFILGLYVGSGLYIFYIDHDLGHYQGPDFSLNNFFIRENLIIGTTTAIRQVVDLFFSGFLTDESI